MIYLRQPDGESRLQFRCSSQLARRSPSATSLDAKCISGPFKPLAVFLHGPPRHLASAGWPHHILTSVSATISSFVRSSAYIFLSRWFSNFSSFIRAIIKVSVPPYLVRQLWSGAELIPNPQHRHCNASVHSFQGILDRAGRIFRRLHLHTELPTIEKVLSFAFSLI